MLSPDPPDRPARAVRIRLLRPDDVRAVARLERVVFGREGWPASVFALLGHAFAAARPPRGRFWVASIGGRLVGYAGVERSVLGGEADLINLAVDPAYRRQGLGRRLLTTALAWCRAQGVPLLWLRVRAGNRAARAFYRRCGFRVVGRFAGYYRDPREDAVLMARRPWPDPPRRGVST